ncbi:MAG: beta-propeller domain-containing protein [Candidatus Aenigmatarchaeota archaeon]
MKNIAMAVVGLVIISVLLFYPYAEPEKQQLKKFSSESELKSYIKAAAESGTYYGTREIMTTGATKQGAESAPTTDGTSGSDYSTTNIQVAGVDEADIVKNDGKYIYTISNNKITIVDAYPAESAKILSEIKFENTSVSNIFINKDRLIAFGNNYDYYYSNGGVIQEKVGVAQSEMMPYPYYRSDKTFINIYDISDRENPTLVKNYTMDGNYYNSRMIGDYVYLITNQYVNNFENPVIPIAARCGVGCIDVWYFDVPESNYQFTIVSSVNVQTHETSTKVFLMGYTQNMYVSTDNIYITYSKRLTYVDFLDKIVDALLPLVPSETEKINEIMNSKLFSNAEKFSAIGRVLSEYSAKLTAEERLNFQKNYEEKLIDVQTQIAKEMEKTVIHKISISNGNIEYKVQGEASGNTLNQFSMDEYNGYFRIATTTDAWSGQSKNHVYVLDDSLAVVGKLEDLASGERIYSVRFIGNKGYMVTFRQIDPLFIIDLENPSNPSVLGYLKIPGVSDYLHPYDETHIIGVGRDASDEGRIKGMKLSLFDVSDVSNPKEISKYFIGERGTQSEALNDHKAFLFSRQKNLLVIPISLVEGGEEWRWEKTWYGAFVFNVDLVNGFTLKGKVTHSNQTNDGYYYDYSSQIRRSLYMDDVLYTISGSMIKMNDLNDMTELNKVIY